MLQTHASEELILQRPKIDQTRFRQIIRDLGLKVTNQRLAILETICTGRAHVTAQEVFELVYQKCPDIGFATVYRFLRTLSEHNFVTELRVGGQSARYEWKTNKHHDHLSCESCGRICEFENEQIEELQKKVAARFGFVLTGHVLELYGICLACKEK